MMFLYLMKIVKKILLIDNEKAVKSGDAIVRGACIIV